LKNRTGIGSSGAGFRECGFFKIQRFSLTLEPLKDASTQEIYPFALMVCPTVWGQREQSQKALARRSEPGWSQRNVCFSGR